MWYGGKVYDEFQIPVRLKRLLKINLFFRTVLSLRLLVALAFQGKTMCGHCCLPDSMYGTVILMCLFSKPFVHKIIP